MRRRWSLGPAAVLLLIVAASLATLALSRPTHEAEATAFTRTMSDGAGALPGPDEPAVQEQILALVPASATAAHRVQVVHEPATYLFRVAARDREPLDAAQRADVAARDLVAAGHIILWSCAEPPCGP